MEILILLYFGLLETMILLEQFFMVSAAVSVTGAVLSQEERKKYIIAAVVSWLLPVFIYSVCYVIAWHFDIIASVTFFSLSFLMFISVTCIILNIICAVLNTKKRKEHFLTALAAGAAVVALIVAGMTFEMVFEKPTGVSYFECVMWMD